MPEPTSIKSRGALLLELARELRELKEKLEEKQYGSSKSILINNIFEILIYI